MQKSKTVCVCGLDIEKLTIRSVTDLIISAVESGIGGWVVTLNVDLLRISVQEKDAFELYSRADLRIADGMPIVWISKIIGNPLPERVAGSSLSELLVGECAKRFWGVALLGGCCETAETSAELLRNRYPGLKIQANSHLQFTNPPTKEEIFRAIQYVDDDARLVLVGLGSPKQEAVIAELRRHRPQAWMMGVGGTFNFLSGRFTRAPFCMQKCGFEWAHRLLLEPCRLTRRYLVEDMPFFLQLISHAMIDRVNGRKPVG